MKIGEALLGVSLLGLDTMPFIYLVERNPVYVDWMCAIFRRVDAGDPQAVDEATLCSYNSACEI